MKTVVVVIPLILIYKTTQDKHIFVILVEGVVVAHHTGCRGSGHGSVGSSKARRKMNNTIDSPCAR
jgi:hypothetical protein